MGGIDIEKAVQPRGSDDADATQPAGALDEHCAGAATSSGHRRRDARHAAADDGHVKVMLAV